MLGFSAADCIVLEDVPAGVRAGKAAGAKVVAFPSTVSRAVLQAEGADWVLRNCADVRLLSGNHCLTIELRLPA